MHITLRGGGVDDDGDGDNAFATAASRWMMIVEPTLKHCVNIYYVNSFIIKRE